MEITSVGDFAKLLSSALNGDREAAWLASGQYQRVVNRLKEVEKQCQAAEFELQENIATETVQCEHRWSNGRRCQLVAAKGKSAEGKSHCPIHYNFPKQTPETASWPANPASDHATATGMYDHD